MNKAIYAALALAGVLTGLGVLVLVCQSADPYEDSEVCYE